MSRPNPLNTDDWNTPAEDMIFMPDRQAIHRRYIEIEQLMILLGLDTLVKYNPLLNAAKERYIHNDKWTVFDVLVETIKGQQKTINDMQESLLKRGPNG